MKKFNPKTMKLMILSSALVGLGYTSVSFAAGGGIVAPYSSSYAAMLANAYSNFAHLENNDRTDQIDADELKTRAVAAYNGNNVLPLRPDQVRSVQASPAQLQADYQAINRATMNPENLQQYPRDVAMAQAAYDCYALQQQSEPYASHNLRRCEPTFRYLMSKLDRPMAAAEPAPQPKMAAAPVVAPVLVRYDVVETQVVYFDWDKATLTEASRSKLNEVKAGMAGEENTWKRIALTAHTDRSGKELYNQGLSERRLRAVREYLQIIPVDTAEVDTRALGENNPPVPTIDGVREPRNRVVEIMVVKEKAEAQMPATEGNPSPTDY